MSQKLYMIERRLQELAAQIENQHRLGYVAEEPKFDTKNKRWLVKFSDGPIDQNQNGQGQGDSGSGSSGASSGSGSGSSGGGQGDNGSGTDNHTVTTTWLPWSSHSHGTIKISNPPKKGQKVQCHAPNGHLGMASVSAFSYGKGAESPHDKPDEFYFRVEEDTSQSNSSSNSGSASSSQGSGSTSSSTSSQQQTNNKQFNVLATKDGMKAWIGNASYQMTANSHTLTMGNHTATLNTEGMSISIENGKSTLNLTKDSIKALSDMIQSKSTDGSASVTVDDNGVDTQGKTINDG